MLTSSGCAGFPETGHDASFKLLGNIPSAIDTPLAKAIENKRSKETDPAWSQISPSPLQTLSSHPRGVSCVSVSKFLLLKRVPVVRWTGAHPNDPTLNRITPQD